MVCKLIPLVSATKKIPEAGIPLVIDNWFYLLHLLLNKQNVGLMRIKLCLCLNRTGIGLTLCLCWQSVLKIGQ